MLLDHYVSAMPCWKGRVDSDSDYDAFRWHQWVQPLDLNDGGAPFDGALGFAFVGFCSDKGVARNKGRTGTALAPDFVRGQMSNLPCTFSHEVKLFDAGDIVDIKDAEGHLFARGKAAFASDEVELACGRTREAMERNRLLAPLATRPLVHRDELIVFE